MFNNEVYFKEVLNKMWNMYFLKWKYLYLTKYKSYYKKRINNLPQENKKTMSYHKENNYDKKIVELINWKCLKFNCLEFWDLQKSKYVKEKLIRAWNTIELIMLQFCISTELPNRAQRKKPMIIDNRKHLYDQDVIMLVQIKKKLFVDPNNCLNLINLYNNIN